jgi:DNA-binding NarL/FixJ family response regulator
MDEARILVVADRTLHRRGLVSLLTAQGFEVVGTATDGEEAVGVALRHQPDVAIVDRGLARGALEAVRTLADRLGDALAVVVQAGVHDPADMLAAVRAGAVGYLTRDCAPERVGDAIRGVLRGEAALSRVMAAHLIRQVRAGSTLPPANGGTRGRLTPRQLEILRLIAAGSTTAEIARELYLSPETVRWHVKGILGRLGARTRAEAAAVYREVTA